MRFMVLAAGLCMALIPAAALGESPVFPVPRAAHHDGPAFDRTAFWVVGSLGMTALLVSSDDNHRGIIRTLENVPPVIDGAMDVGNAYGDGLVVGGAALALTGLGAAFHPPTLAAGQDLLRSLGIAWSATWALKLGVNAERPNGGSYSFPSGHTATAFAAAPVITHHYGKAAGAAAYGLGVLTALGRMEDNKHFLQDVLVGAAIGYTAGRMAVSARSFSLGAVPGGVGVSLPLSY